MKKFVLTVVALWSMQPACMAEGRIGGENTCSPTTKTCPEGTHQEGRTVSTNKCGTSEAVQKELDEKCAVPILY